jgi:hypothetical protein
MENVIAWKFCPQCGKELRAEWKHCSECGNDIGVTAQPQVVHVPILVTPQDWKTGTRLWVQPYIGPFWSSPNTCGSTSGVDMGGISVWAGTPPEMRAANISVFLQ